MTISRTHTWTTNEVLTSAEINAVDANVTNAIDMRAGALDITSQDVAVWLPLARLGITAGWDFFPETSGQPPMWCNSDVSATKYIHFPVTPRGAGTLKSLTFYMMGSYNNSHTAFPVMPTFALNKVQTGSKAYTQLQLVTALSTGNFGDGPTNFGGTLSNYENVWNVVLSNGGAGFTGLDYGSNVMPTVAISGESGANGKTQGLAVLGIKAIWTCTKLVATG